MTINKRRRIKRPGALCAAIILMTLFVVLGTAYYNNNSRPALRIRDWETGEVYVKCTVSPGDEVYFGWIHSLEKIPWNEYYHIDGELKLVLDTISFPAFGAGIPQNKGTTCYIKDGLIYMSGIDETFSEFVWMNSPTATQEIRVNGAYITRGSELPHNRRLVLTVERRNFHAG